MSTGLTPITPPSVTINTFTVADLIARVNKRRRENNDDFLDATDGFEYINDASDELNLDDDFKSKQFSATFVIDTNVNPFYDFTTIFTDQPFERLSGVRMNDRGYKNVFFSPNTQYVIEPNPAGAGQGIRFLCNLQDTIEFLYYAYLPRVTLPTDPLPLSPESNPYYLNKMLQYIYESEAKEDRARIYEQRAETAKMLLMNSNTYEYDTEVHLSSHFTA